MRRDDKSCEVGSEPDSGAVPWPRAKHRRDDGGAALMRARILLTVLTVVMLAGPARAAFESGDWLWEVCTGTSQDRLVCLGYVTGVADTLIALTGEGKDLNGWRACLSESVTNGQAIDVAVKLLREHPEWRRYTASSLVARALAEAFPCRSR